MADLPEVIAYQARVGLRDQRVSSLQAELDTNAQRLSAEQSKYTASVNNSNFRKGPPALPTIQKLNFLSKQYEENRKNFESQQIEAQKIIDQENAEVQQAYLDAQAAQAVEAQRQLDLSSRLQTGNITKAEFAEVTGSQYASEPDAIKGDLENLAYYNYIQSKGKSLTSEQVLDKALSAKFAGALGKSPEDIAYHNKQVEIENKDIAPYSQKLILGGKPVISQEGNKFTTTSGEVFTQVNGLNTNQVLNGNNNSPTPKTVLSLPELVALKNQGVSVSSVKGDLGNAVFTKGYSPSVVQDYAGRQLLEADIAKYNASLQSKNNDLVSGINNYVSTVSAPVIQSIRPYAVPVANFFNPIFKYGVETATVPVKVVADVSRPFRQSEFFQNELLASKQISEAPFIIGANVGRGIYETARGSAKGFYEYTSPGQLGEYTPFGLLNKQFYGSASNPSRPQNAGNYTPILSDEQSKIVEERGAIALGTVTALAPYVAGGAIANIQHVADIGSAFKESPSKAATLIGVGVASTVLFNELGSVSKVIKGQLGGTVVNGGSQLADYFETATKTGGKIIGLGLLLPYAVSTLPPLASNFESGNTEGFREGVTGLQRTSGPLFLGANIGQKLSTGFTLFTGSQNAITTGGLTAPTETIARERLIANTFDATYTPPQLTVEQNKQIKELLGKGGTITSVDARGGVKISFEQPQSSKIGEAIDNVKAGAEAASPKSIQINPPATPFEIRQLYESEGFTKAKFLESYETIFHKLPSVKVTPKEYDVSNVEGIANNPKAQKVLLEYFQGNTKEFSIYGSGVQGPQLEGVYIRPSGDIDTAARNPKEFGEGLLTAFKKAGFTDKDFGVFKDSVGEYSIYAGPDKAKFINIHPYADEFSSIFSQAEEVTGLFPRRIFTETPSGISITNIALQGERKVVGGFGAGPGGLRPKDIGDVATITEGVKGYISPPITNQSNGSDFGLTTIGKIELFTGIIPPGTKVKDILNIGVNSQPIKDISKATGVSPKQLVKEFNEINVKRGSIISSFTTGEQGRFSVGLENPTDLSGDLRVAPFSGSGTDLEGVLVHELTHAGQNIGDVRLPHVGQSGQSYYNNPRELQAFRIQQSFLNSKGLSLDADQLELLNLPKNKFTSFDPLIVSGQSASVPQSESIAETLGFANSQTFGLSPHGVHIIKSGYLPQSSETTLGSIFRLGKESQPIQNISITTGEKPEVLVNYFKQLKIQTTPEFDNPSQFAGFGFDKDLPIQPSFKSINPPGALGIAIKAGPSTNPFGALEDLFTGGGATNKLTQEGAIAHELSHAGDYIAGTFRGNTSGITGKAYYELPSEARAFNVQQNFLSSKGGSIDLEALTQTGISGGKNFIKPNYNEIPDVVNGSLPAKSTGFFSLNNLIVESKKNTINSQSTDVTALFGKDNYTYTPNQYKAPPFLLVDIYPPKNNYPKQQTPYAYPKYVKPDVYKPLITQSYGVVAPYKSKPGGYGTDEPYLPDKYIPPTDQAYGEGGAGGDGPYNPPPDDSGGYTPPGGPYEPVGVAPYTFTPPGKPGSPPVPYVFPKPEAKKTYPEKKQVFPKKSIGGTGYNVFVLTNKGGKKQFLQVDKKGVSLSKLDALKYGETIVDQALEASFFIKPSKSSLGKIGSLPELSYKYRLSKNPVRKNIPTYVELETYRLDTGTEVRKIHAARIAAKLRKSIIKNKIPNKGKKNFYLGGY